MPPCATMTHFDVFNGDADGLCALRQLRLARPLRSILVTGPKRDITLLQRVPAMAGDTVTVLDISLDVNRAALVALLASGVAVSYYDHHGSGEIPACEHLHALIDTRPGACTATIVDQELNGAFRAWAIAGAFGDNQQASARALAASIGLSPGQCDRLQALGTCLNYNAYGDEEQDLFIPPAMLYRLLEGYRDPFAFIDREPVVARLQRRRDEDIGQAAGTPPCIAFSGGRVLILPDAAWSRRVRGAYANILTNRHPSEAIAVLTPNRLGGYTASVRAPLQRRHDADTLCARFPTGGGRSAAAGINHLPASRLPAFLSGFQEVFTAAGLRA